MNLKQALKILDLEKGPSLDEIKSAYRRLALAYHPDRNPNEAATVIFREATEAYNYLIEHIEEWVIKEPTVIKKSSPKTEETSVTNVENIFDDIFGFTRQNRVLGFEEPQGLEVNLHDLYFGGKKRAKLMAYARCTTCEGSGCIDGTLATICTYCFGAGSIKKKDATRKKCTVCGGRGKKINYPCRTCEGFGRVKKFVSQEIDLPMGLKSGEAFTLASVALSKQKEKLNIFVIPRLLKEGFFRVEKTDLICQYPVTENELRKNKKFMFPFPAGLKEVCIKDAGGDSLVVDGLGLPLDPRGKKRGQVKISLVVLPEREVLSQRKKIIRELSRDFESYRKDLDIVEKIKIFLSL